MSVHRCTTTWALNGGDFLGKKYSRVHSMAFEGGVTVPGSSSPTVVPVPWSSHEAVDPEAAFVAALSACHMLWFLDHAGRQGFVVETYRDAAEGILGRLPGEKKLVMTKVTLRPEVTFGGDRRPSASEAEALHHAAHEDCFIANSVKTEVVIEAA